MKIGISMQHEQHSRILHLIRDDKKGQIVREGNAANSHLHDLLTLLALALTAQPPNQNH